MARPPERIRLGDLLIQQGLLTHEQLGLALAEQTAAHAKQVEELYAEIGRLTTQVNWLKKKLPS